MTKLKIAIIGAGNMASEHAKAFADIPDAQIVGFYSRTKAKADALADAYKCSAYSSVQELFQGTKADLVIITVTELSMRDICFEAFKFSWKILAEKPVGYNPEIAKQILDEMKAKKSQVYVAMNRRHYSSTRKLIEELNAKDGQRFIHVCDQQDQKAAREFGQPEAVIQNYMYANSIHLVDYFQVLGRGTIVKIEPVLKWNAAQPFHVVAKLTYSSGDIGLYEAAWNRAGPWSVTVTAPAGRWEAKPLESVGFQAYGTRKLEPLPTHAWDTQFKPGLRLQAQEAINLLKGLPHKLPSLEESFETMKLIKEIYS